MSAGDHSVGTSAKVSVERHGTYCVMAPVYSCCCNAFSCCLGSGTDEKVEVA